jgi:hypothetical protein
MGRARLPYVTDQTWKPHSNRCQKTDPSKFAMYFHYQTSLVGTFRTLFPDTFFYEKNRAIVFDENDRVPIKVLRTCIAMALTYHLAKKR